MRFRFSFLFLTLLSVSVSCGDPATEGPQTGDGDGVGGTAESPCGLGQGVCDGVCTSLSSPTSCGACGVTCGIEELCSAGACIPAAEGCPGGFTECGGGCVDLTVSPLHCGACDSACAVEDSCSAGVCVEDPMGTGGNSATGGASSGGAGSGGASSGGASSGGASTGGAASGGASTGGASTGGSGPTDPYACDGPTDGYKTLMVKSGSTWTVTRTGQQVHSGTDMEAALRAAYASLTSGRTSKEAILVQGSGDISASSQVGIPSYTVVNFCGTLNVSGTPSGSDRSPLYARNARDIEIPNLKMTGSPQYGIFFRGTNNMHLGQIDLRLTRSAGIGVRVDTSGSAGSDSNFNQNLRIDYIFGSGMASHIVETYGIDGVTIGEVEGDDVGECGLLLNRSINATIDLVSCTDCAVGTGYAAFRMANNNGVINGNHDTVNIIAKSVIARGGGRGIFSVSGSGAARIDQIDIEGTGNNSILLENAHNVTVGNTTTQSRVANSGQLRIAGTSSDILIRNIAVSGTTLSESPCASNSTWTNVNGAPGNCN